MPHARNAGTLCFLILTLAGAWHPARAQTAGTHALPAVRTAVPPKLDGVLDDEAWSGATLPLGPWMSYNPLRGEPAAADTQVWIAYDDSAIYFAFKCLDADPRSIRTTISRRDNAWSDDWVGISLDSSRAGQVAYHMFVNPSGIQMDGLNTGSNGEDMAPDWVWQSAGSMTEDGYIVEIRLPLESIRFRSGPHVEMGVLFFRRQSRSGVSWSWPEMQPGKWVFESNAPIVFDNLWARPLLEVTPSVTFSRSQIRTPPARWDGAQSKGDFGASVKYGLTSTVTLEGTVNPDFSQVESDAFEVQVNNRFPIFFAEKRSFFMEGLGLFNLAGTGNDASMRTAVHTRRIVDPSAGVKLTGTAGRQSFVFLSAADASPSGGRQRLFTIGRDVLNLGNGQYVGLLATDTELSREHNRVAGGDVAMKLGARFTWNGSFLTSHSTDSNGAEKRGIGAQGYYSYNTRRVSVSGQLEHYDRGFQMDTAFLNRVGMTRGWQYQEVLFYPDRPSYAWIKRVAPFFWVASARDRVQGGTELYVLPGIRFNFTRAGSLRLDYGRGHETFVGRRFETGAAKADGSVQPTRWLRVNATLSSGPAIYYDQTAPFQGDKTSVKFGFDLQASARLSHNVSYSFASFDRRDDGRHVYQVHVASMRTIYQFSPRFLVRSIEEFDSASRHVLVDVLASYELSPGTVAHAGYGSLLDGVDGGAYRATARALFVKVAYRAHL